MEQSQVEGIIERARTCAVGRDYDGVLRALAELETGLMQSESGVDEPASPQADGGSKPGAE